MLQLASGLQAAAAPVTEGSQVKPGDEVSNGVALDLDLLAAIGCDRGDRRRDIVGRQFIHGIAPMLSWGSLQGYC